jgi:hypothetical protein
MKLMIRERRKENGERQFIGMILLTNQNTDFGTIIISEIGMVRLVSKKALSLFGFEDEDAHSIVGKVYSFSKILEC